MSSCPTVRWSSQTLTKPPAPSDTVTTWFWFHAALQTMLFVLRAVTHWAC
ncbi:MAG: hypothetical protein IPJ04_17220, partial [Candidatus Eisenbacteria bacterium]|nr:hypothetical protein [Candidatus Eisenbacteria bacterium]